MAREAARLPPAVPSPLPRPDLRPRMVITFSPPPGAQAPPSSEVEMEWEPTTPDDVSPRLPLSRDAVIPDSQEDQDDILFSPLPKGTVIPDSEEDSDITFAHVLAKRLYDDKVQGQKHSLRIILFRYIFKPYFRIISIQESLHL